MGKERGQYLPAPAETLGQQDTAAGVRNFASIPAFAHLSSLCTA